MDKGVYVCVFLTHSNAAVGAEPKRHFVDQCSCADVFGFQYSDSSLGRMQACSCECLSLYTASQVTCQSSTPAISYTVCVSRIVHVCFKSESFELKFSNRQNRLDFTGQTFTKLLLSQT